MLKIKLTLQNLHEVGPNNVSPQTPFKMGKRSRKQSENMEQVVNGIGKVNKSILVDEEAVDPSLALLFSSSVGTPTIYSY